MLECLKVLFISLFSYNLCVTANSLDWDAKHKVNNYSFFLFQIKITKLLNKGYISQTVIELESNQEISKETWRSCIHPFITKTISKYDFSGYITDSMKLELKKFINLALLKKSVKNSGCYDDARIDGGKELEAIEKYEHEGGLTFKVLNIDKKPKRLHEK